MKPSKKLIEWLETQDKETRDFVWNMAHRAHHCKWEGDEGYVFASLCNNILQLNVEPTEDQIVADLKENDKEFKDLPAEHQRILANARTRGLVWFLSKALNEWCRASAKWDCEEDYVYRIGSSTFGDGFLGDGYRIPSHEDEGKQVEVSSDKKRWYKRTLLRHLGGGWANPWRVEDLSDWEYARIRIEPECIECDVYAEYSYYRVKTPSDGNASVNMVTARKDFHGFRSPEGEVFTDRSIPNDISEKWVVLLRRDGE